MRRISPIDQNYGPLTRDPWEIGGHVVKAGPPMSYNNTLYVATIVNSKMHFSINRKE